MKLPYIKPNNKGCLYCQKTCSCIKENNHSDLCYKARMNILINNLNNKKTKYNSFFNIILDKSLEITDKTTIYDITEKNNKRKIFTTTFDTEFLYILDSSSNIYLKPYKKRKFVKHTDI
jgi:hypothetical protein